jgi:hypothetical protein
MTASAASSAYTDPTSKAVPNIDIERGVAADAFVNTTVRSLAWKGLTVTVIDRETKLPKTIVDNVDGIVEAGQYPCPLVKPSLTQTTEQARSSPSWVPRAPARPLC